MNRRRLTLATLAALGLGGGVRLAAAMATPIRIGLTPVFLDDQVGFLEAWRAWLETRLERQVEFVTRSSYREIVDLIRAGQIDFAWLCGYPYLRHRDDLRLVALPLWQGKPLYRSYIITASDNRGPSSILDLRRRVFAYSDPDSNSGYLYPRYALTRAGHAPDAYFTRTFFTWAHRLVVRAVAEGLAHGGAVDGYVWEVLAATRPELVARTRVIERSGEMAHPPFVARRDIGLAEEQAFFNALAAMARDTRGRELLAALRLDGFVRSDLQPFAPIAEMMRAVGVQMPGAR